MVGKFAGVGLEVFQPQMDGMDADGRDGLGMEVRWFGVA
jgi:hypothetical protein